MSKMMDLEKQDSANYTMIYRQNESEILQMRLDLVF